MNIYILVEGEKTEMEVYPVWISHLLPKLQKVNFYTEVKSNNYVLMTGGGIPNIYKTMNNSIHDINSHGNFDYFIIVIDSEELTTERRREICRERIEPKLILNPNCQFKIVVQNSCIETWFLGNRAIYQRNPQGDVIKDYCKFYNVEINDPELMGCYPRFPNTAHFHHSYLREMLKEKNVNYNKSRPNHVTDKPYLNQIIKRITDEQDHLNSFRYFYNLILEIREGMD